MKRKLSRRQFVKSLAASSSSLIVNSSLGGAIGASFFANQKPALADTPKFNVLNIYLDGGVRMSELFSPQRAAARVLANGSTQRNFLLGLNDLINGEMGRYDQLELGGAYSVAPGTNTVVSEQGENVYVPPIFRGANGLEFGPCAGALAPFANRITILDGMVTSIDHDAAAKMLWTGDTFSPVASRPTFDCLLAAKLGAGLLLPHLLWQRSGYVPLSIPQEVPLAAMGMYADGSQYRAALAKEYSPALAKSSRDYVGDDALKLLNAYWESSGANSRVRMQSEANRQFFDIFSLLSKTRANLYSSNFLDEMRTAIDSFTVTARANMGEIFGRGGDMTPNLLPALGMVRYAFQNGLSSVACINVGNGNWDAHGGWLSGRHPHKYRTVMYGIAEFLKAVDLDKTIVVISSELGRTSGLNQNGGTDHAPATTLLLIGGPVGRGVRFGASSPFFDASDVDPSTGMPSTSGNAMRIRPAHVLALLLEAAGYSVGRPIESLLGIRQAPDFLRNLLG